MARTPKRPPQTARRKVARASRKTGAERRTRPIVRGSAARTSGYRSAGRQVRHREVEDSFWRAALRIRAVAIWLLGLEEYVVVEPLPAPRLRGLGENRVQLDLLYLCSMIVGDNEEQARKRLQRMQSTGREGPLGFTYYNVELKVEQQPGRDGNQLYEHRVGMRREHGRMCPLRSGQFVSGERPPSRWRLGGMGGDEWGESTARVNFRGRFNADHAPAAVREDPAGAIVLLRLRNGRKRKHMRHALAGVLGGHWDLDLATMLLDAMQMDAKLCTIVERELRNLQEGKIMANGVAVSPTNLKAFHRAVDAMVQGVLDKTQLPSFRRVIRQHEREQQKLERELEREQQKLEREQQKRQASQVAGLLGILAGRGMRLTPAQEKRLNAKPLAKLPPYRLALQAEDATDFARRAGLTNGRK